MTPRPRDRITLGRRLPNSSKTTTPIMMISNAPGAQPNSKKVLIETLSHWWEIWQEGQQRNRAAKAGGLPAGCLQNQLARRHGDAVTSALTKPNSNVAGIGVKR